MPLLLHLVNNCEQHAMLMTSTYLTVHQFIKH